MADTNKIGRFTLEKKKIAPRLPVFIIVTFLVLVTGLSLIINKNHSFYLYKVRTTKANLLFSRRSIRLFVEQNGRFPNSLVELNEYGKKFPDKIQWYFTSSESISKSSPNYSEHSILDGTGGLYYNPETGELKINLTKPLKYYCRFYFGEKRKETPSNW